MNLLKQIEHAQQLLGLENPEFVFEKETGRSPASSLRDALYKRNQKAKIANLSYHDIRRTVSAKLEALGMSPKMIASVLGHSERTNYEYYQDEIIDKDKKTALMQDL